MSEVIESLVSTLKNPLELLVNVVPFLTHYSDLLWLSRLYPISTVTSGPVFGAITNKIHE